MKRTGLAIIAVFVAWGILDFLLHGVLLRGMYSVSPQIWRPMDEIPLWLIYLTTLISAACFVYIYARMLAEPTLAAALRYGLVFGIGAGATAGLGGYATLPISLGMAIIWFLGILVESLAGAWIAWAMHRGVRA